MRREFCIALLLISACPAPGGEDSATPVIGVRPPSPADISRMAARLRDMDAEKAIAAARELGASHLPAAAKPLLSFYQEGDGPRRLAAVKALGELGDFKQAEALFGIAIGDLSQAIRRQAALELARLQGADAAFARLSEASGAAQKYAPLYRARAVHAAAWIGGVKTDSFLREKSGCDDADVAIGAVEELGERRELPNVDALLKLLSADRPELKAAALFYLERLTGNHFGFDLVKWTAWRRELREKNGGELPLGTYADASLEQRPVDLVIAFDTTGSFLHVWADVSRTIESVLREVVKNEPSVRIGLVRYRSVDPRAALKYTLLPTALTWDTAAVRRELSAAAFGGGSGALHEGLRYALNGMAWRAYSRKMILIVGDDSPSSPVENGMQSAVQLTREAGLLDGIQINTLYAKTTAGEENRLTYRAIAEAGIGRFYEFNKAERHLVELGAEKVDVKHTELPDETARKWLMPVAK